MTRSRAYITVVGFVALLTTASCAPSAATTPSTPTAAVSEQVDRLPPTLPLRSGVGLPERINLDGAANLSDSPVRRAVALVSPWDRNSGQDGKVHVIGEDGVARVLDVVALAPTRDAGGNTAAPLKVGALSPDGALAAFAQPDEVIVVDVTKAVVRRIPVPGLNEFVRWMPSGALLVARDADAHMVDLGSGNVRKIQTSLWDMAAEAPLQVTGGDKPAVRMWSGDFGAVTAELPITSTLPDGFQIREWYGPAWRSGDLIARSGWSRSEQVDGAEAVAVIDARTGRIVRLLDLGMGRWKACCTTLGWLDLNTVLVRTSGQDSGIVAWDIRTGAVTLVTAQFDGTITLANPQAR